MKGKIVGIDIGSIYTKVVELDIKGKVPLANTFLIPTPLSSNVEGKKSIDRDILCQNIIDKIPLHSLNKSLIVISIPILSPVVTTVILPKMSKRELGVAASIGARRKMVSQPGPDSVFETLFLREVIESNIPRYEVLVVREEKEFITMASDLFKKFNLYPHIVTPICAALGSMFAKKPEYRDKKIAFIDIGYNSINISVNRGANVIFNRNISFGCKDVIEGLSGSLGVTYQQAENILLENGIPNIPFDSKNRVAVAEEIMRQKYEAGREGRTTDEVNQLELRMLMEQFLERIIQEIRRTFIYFKERHGTREIEKIFFLGGGALINNLVNLVGIQISPHPEIINISKITNVSLKDNTYKDKLILFSGAMALALSATLKAKETVNFLPFEFKKKREIILKRFVLSVSCIVIICSFFLGWINLWLISASREKLLKEVNFEIERFRKKQTKTKNIVRMIESIKNREKIVESLIKKKKNFLPILRLLAVKETNQMVFSYLHIGKSEDNKKGASMGEGNGIMSERGSFSTEASGYAVKLEVDVLGDYEKSCDIMENFISDLKKSFYFKSVSLTIPDFGVVVPIISEDKVVLTKVKWRKFIVKAALNI